MLTVVLATYNGAATLPTTLRSFTGLIEPEGGWKLIVIDNGSTDETPTILKSFCDHLPLTILSEPERGKNRALNRAIPYLEGELAVFTDDDTVVPPDWLRLYENLAAEKPHCTVLGGRVVPRWPDTEAERRVARIPQGPAYAAHPKELASGSVDPGMIWGPNMAVRRHVFDDGTRFDESVGPGPGQYIMGSETELNHRLHRLGHENWLSNEIVVEHQIRPHQLTAIWLARRARRFGAATARRDSGGAARRVFGIELWRCRMVGAHALQWLWAVSLGKPPERLESVWFLNFHLTQMRTTRRRLATDRTLQE